jgi:hypothetical protein
MEKVQKPRNSEYTGLTLVIIHFEEWNTRLLGNIQNVLLIYCLCGIVISGV